MKKMSLKDYSSFLIKEEADGEETANKSQDSESSSSGKSIRIIFSPEDIKAMDQQQASKYLLSFDIFDAIINDKSETDLQKAFAGESLGGQGGGQKLNVGKTIRLDQLLKVGGKGLSNPQKYLDKLDKSMPANELQGQQQKVKAYVKVVKDSIEFLVNKEVKGIRLENKNKVIRVNKASYIRTVKRILSGQTTIFKEDEKSKRINLQVLLSSLDQEISQLLKTSDKRKVKKQEKAESEVKSIVSAAETFDAFWDRAFKTDYMNNPKLKASLKDKETPEEKEKFLRQSRVEFNLGVYGSRSADIVKQFKNAIRDKKFDFVAYILTAASFKKTQNKDPNRQFTSRIKDELFIKLFKQLCENSLQISNETMQKILTQVNNFYSAGKNISVKNIKSTKEYKAISRLLAEEGKTVTAQSTSEVSSQEAIENSDSTTNELFDTPVSEEEAEGALSDLGSDEEESDSKAKDKLTLKNVKGLPTSYTDSNEALGVLYVADIIFSLEKGVNAFYTDKSLNSTYEPFEVLQRYKSIEDNDKDFVERLSIAVDYLAGESIKILLKEEATSRILPMSKAVIQTLLTKNMSEFYNKKENALDVLSAYNSVVADQQFANFSKDIFDEEKEDTTSDSSKEKGEEDKINFVSITPNLSINGTKINKKSYFNEAYPLLLATGATALRLAANLDFNDIKSKIFKDQEKIEKHATKNITQIFHPDTIDGNKDLSEDQKEQIKPLAELFFDSLMTIGKSYNENNDSYGIKFEFANYDKEQQEVIIKKSEFEKACNDVYSKYIKESEASLTDIFNDINKMLKGESIDTESEEVVSPVDGSEEIQKSEEEKKEDGKTYTKLLSDLSQIKNNIDASLGIKDRKVEDLKGEKEVKMTYEEWLATDNITQVDSSNLLTKPMSEIVDQDDFDAYTASGNSGEIFHEMVTTRVGESKSFNDRALLQSIKKVANENELKQFLKNATDDGKDKLKVKIVDIMVKNLVIKATLDAVGLNKISGSITESLFGKALKKVTGSKMFKAAKLSAGIGGAALSLGGLLGSAPIVAAVGSVAMGVFASMSIMKRLSNSLTFKEEYKKFSDDPVGYISKNFVQDKKYQNKVLKPIVNNLIAYQATICVYKEFKGNLDVQSAMSGRDKSFEKAKEKFSSLPEEKQEQIRVVFSRAFKLLQDCPWHFQSKNNEHAKLISQGSINILFNELFFGEDPLPEDIINKISSGEGISGLSEKESAEVLKKILEVIRDKTSINSTIVDFINDSIKHHCGIGKGKFQSVKDYLSRKNRAKFIQDKNQSFNVPRNILTATQKGLDSFLGTKFGSEKESKSFFGNQEVQREEYEKIYDEFLLRQISNCNNEEEYNERYQSRKVSENFASYKNLIKNNSLSYLLFEADGDEVKSNLETPQPSQPQDVEIVPTDIKDIELAVAEVLFKPAMAGLRSLMSLFSGLADASTKGTTKADIDIADAGAQAATAGKAATTTTETVDVFYESLDKASSVLSKGKDAVSRVLELPDGTKMICYFSNKSGSAAEKMSAIIYDPTKDAYLMVGRMEQIETYGYAKMFKLEVAQSVAEGKFVLSASSQAMPVPMNQAVQDLARASEEVFGSITQKITAVVQKSSVSEVPPPATDVSPAADVSNISADAPVGSSFEGGIKGAQTQGFSGKMSQEQANRVFADFLENPEKLDETLEALKSKPKSILNPSKPMEIEPAAKIVTPEDTTITKTIVKKLSPSDSTQGLDLQTGKETYTFKTPGSGEASAGKAAGAGTGSSEAGAGAGKVAGGGDAGQSPLQVPPTQIPDWLSTAKSASLYAAVTNGIHSAYERSNFKVIRGGIFGRVFFEKYSPSKIIAVDIFDALKGGAPTSTRSLTNPNVSLPTATDTNFMSNGDLPPMTPLGIEGPSDNAMPALETPSIVLLGSDDKPQGKSLPSPKQESYVYNISLKDFLFENKVVIKNKRKW